MISQADKMKKFLIFSLLGNVLFLILFGLIIRRLGGVKYLKYRMNSNSISAQYDHKKSLYQQLMSNKGGIIFLGDSITEAGEWSELFDTTSIRNRGIAGDVSSALFERLDDVIGLSPNKVFLMIGVNDLLFVSVEEVVKNYKAIVEKITTAVPTCQLYLQSVLPINTEVRNIPISNESIRSLNDAIQQIAKENKLQYLDIHSLLKDKQGNLKAQYTQDGIHINGEAYVVWSQAIKEHVE